MTSELLCHALGSVWDQSESRTQTLSGLSSKPEFVVGWGTLSLLNAGIAQGKNRSGLNWFLLSLFLGPVATFVLVVFCDKLPQDL